MEENIKIIIKNIEVDEGYYSFDYEIISDRRPTLKDSYEDDYCNGMSPDDWKKCLEDGEAVETVLASVFA